MHRNGKVDFHVLPCLRDALFSDHLVEPHRHLEDGECWVSHTLPSSDEANEAAWLLRVLVALRSLAAQELDRSRFEKAFEHHHRHTHQHPALDAAVRLAADQASRDSLRAA